MKGLLNISYYFIFSNLLIAGAAVSQSCLSYYILQIPIDPYILLLEWSITILLYNLSMWLSIPKGKVDVPYLRTQWFYKNRLIFCLLSLLACALWIYCIFQLHTYTILFLACIGFLSLAYTVPLIKHRGKMISLRQIIGLKVFLIALVWTLSVVGLPVVEYYVQGGVFDWNKVWVWIPLVALFILAITLPFDIRDMKQDQYYKLKTIPLLIGKNNAQLLCYILIVLHFLLVVLLHGILPFIAGLLLTDVFVLLVFRLLLFKNNAAYEAVYFLDLLLIVQLLLVYVFV